MANYSLEIYSPGSSRDVWVTYESDMPFGGISHGDIINVPDAPGAAPGKTILVKKIEHIFWQSDREGFKHKIMVYTGESFGDPDGLRR